MPVRDIPIGRRAVTGRHARSGARYESSLERDFFELMMFDPQVEKIDEQPVQINYKTETRKRNRYTPDALVTFKLDPYTNQVRRPLLCEVKYYEDLKANFQKLKPRLCAACQYADKQGWRFKVVTERAIRTIYFANMRFLAGFRDRTPDPEQAHLLTAVLSQVGQSDVAALLSSITKDKWQQAEFIPILWWMLGNRALLVDLNIPLTMQSIISIPSWPQHSKSK